MVSFRDARPPNLPSDMAILANQMDLSRPVSLRKLIGYLSGDNAVQFNSAGLPETSGIAASATWTLQNTNYWGQAPINPGTIGTNQTAEQVEIPQFHIIGHFRLYQQDENGKLSGDGIQWANLSLHTWDTVYLSGVSSWNNQFYGMSFARNP
jgi:hypothetical protein